MNNQTFQEMVTVSMPKLNHILPVSLGPPSRPAAANQIEGKGPVIILDDDLDVANTVAAALGVLGYRAAVTASAAEFFDMIDRLSPTHLLIDLFMPEMDGLSVLQCLADHTTARIVVTSGHDVRILESMRQTAIRLGLDVVGRLEKPFRLSKLRTLMDILPSSRKVLSDSSNYTASDMNLQRVLAGLESAEFRLYLQAKTSCATQTIIGYEALVRWDHPKLGLILPSYFVPQIEAAGLEHRLARYMIELSMAFLASRSTTGFHIAVNVTLDTVRKAHFSTDLAELRAKHGIDPSRIILELTESGAGQLTGADIEMLTRLRMDGFLLSLDDFGVGHSSIQRLVQLPLSEVKIDRMFISDMTRSAEARKLVKSIIAMGQALGIEITAEGIEDNETFEELKRLGCTNVQGFFFGRPFPANLANLM